MNNFSLKQIWKQNPSLTILGIFAVVLTVLTGFAAIVDGRTITNVNGWVKPMKFGLSFIFYAFTLVWILSYVEGRPRTVKALSIATLIGSLMEMGLITLQVVRNTTSHFNVSTAFDSTVYYLMAGFVVVIWLATLGIAIVIARQKFTSKALGWSMRLGLIAALIGSAFGFDYDQHAHRSTSCLWRWQRVNSPLQARTALVLKMVQKQAYPSLVGIWRQATCAFRTSLACMAASGTATRHRPHALANATPQRP